MVAAAAATSLSRGAILIVGFANLLGDAVGMGVGDYLSSKAEDDHWKKERSREEWEMVHLPEEEKKEMREIFQAKGLSEEDAREVVDILFQASQPAFLDVMMIEELGIIPDQSTASPWKSGLITFFSFFVLGGIPMLPFLLSGEYNEPSGRDAFFWSAVGLFGVCLFSLGAFKVCRAPSFAALLTWTTGKDY